MGERCHRAPATSAASPYGRLPCGRGGAGLTPPTPRTAHFLPPTSPGPPERQHSQEEAHPAHLHRAPDLCPGEDLRADQVLGGSREGAAGILAGDDRVTGQGECVKDKKVSAWQRGAPLSWQPQLSGRPSWCLGTACPPNPGDGNNDPNTKWLSSPEPCSESLMCSSPFKPHSNLAVGLITHLTGEETISAEPLAPGHWLVSEYPGLEGSNLMPAPPPHGRG